MCMGGSKSSTPAPAPVTQAPNPNNVADNSNDAKRKAATVSTTGAPAPSSFGSELGTGV